MIIAIKIGNFFAITAVNLSLLVNSEGASTVDVLENFAIFATKQFQPRIVSTFVSPAGPILLSATNHVLIYRESFKSVTTSHVVFSSL